MFDVSLCDRASWNGIAIPGDTCVWSMRLCLAGRGSLLEGVEREKIKLGKG